MDDSSRPILRLALPKGRMQEQVTRLLSDAGLRMSAGAREYRPRLSLEGVDVKLLKPQTIVEMLSLGSRDVGFAGADWVAELSGDVVELLDTALDPVKVVAAAPSALLHDGTLPARKLVVATEYVGLAARWIERRTLDATIVRSYGATEVFPPDDADCIVDNTATGSTLRANDLVVVDELLSSSTRLFAHPRALDDADKRALIERLVLLCRSVLDGRRRVMLELNVPADRLDAVIAILPCMRRPTVAALHGGDGYAVKAAVPREALPTLVPELKARGGTDLVVFTPTQIVP